MKIRALIVAFALLFSLYPAVAAADTNTDINNSPESYMVLKALGFVDNEEDLSRNITRGEFAVYVLRLFSMEPISAKEGYFKDLKSDSPAFNAVNSLVDLGVVSKNKDGLFHPDRAIEPNSAVKMLVSALGLDNFAMSEGGYPTGYYIVANSKNIIRDGSFYNGETVTVKQAVDALYNTLLTRVTDSNSYDGNYDWGNELLITRRFSIYQTKGYVTDNGKTTLTALSSLTDGQIAVDGVVYENAGEYSKLLGRKVEAYYKINGDSRYILYAYEKSGNQRLELSYDQIEKYENRVYSYNIDDKTYKAKIDADYYLIYNNIAVYDSNLFNSDMMIPKMGRVELLDNNNDGNYEVVFIWNYTEFIVSGADSVEKTLFNKIDGTSLELVDSTKTYDIKFEDSNPADFISVSMPETLLNIAVSVDEQYYEIIICKKMFRGKIEAQEDDKYVINGSIYTISPYFTKDLSPGVTYDFYLNFMNLISYIKYTNSSENKLGYVIDAGFDNTTIGDSVSIKLYTEDNSILTARTADKVKVGDTRIKPNEVLAKLKESSEIKKQLIRYCLNSEGKFDEIRFFTDKETIVKDMYTYHYSITRVLNNQYPVDPNAKLFVIGDNLDENDIAIRDTSFFGDYGSPYYTMTGYAYDENEPAVINALIVNYGKEFLNYDVDKSPGEEDIFGSCVLVEKVAQAVIDNEKVYKLSVREGYKKAVVYTESLEVLKFEKDKGRYSASGSNTEMVEPGDIIRYGTNKNDRISLGNLIVIYDMSRDYYRSGTGDSYSYTQQSMAYVHTIHRVWIYDKVREWYTFAYKNPATNVLTTDDKAVLILKGNTKVVIFNKETNSVATGTINDILTYKNVGNSCTNGVLFNYQGESKRACLYIYR